MPRPRIYPKDRVQIQIRITPQLRDQLTEEASRRQVSVNLVVENAIKLYLGEFTNSPIKFVEGNSSD